MNFNLIVVVILVLAAGAYAYHFWKKRITLQAAEMVSKLYAVWAELGPFESGAASANALRYAFAAVNNNKSAHLSNIVNLVKHAAAFDADPASWECLRQNSLSGPKDDAFADQLAMAKGMASVESLNEEMFRNAGFKACFESDTNGNLKLVHRNIDTGEIDNRFKDHDEAMGYAMATDIGFKLLKDESFEADLLLEALKTIYNKTNEKDMETAYDLGATYFYMLDHIENNPESEMALMLKGLNEAWLDTRSDVSEGTTRGV